MKLTRDKIQRMVGSQGLVGSGAAGGGGTIGVTEQRVMEILQDYETIDALETTLEDYVTTTALETTLADYATKTYVDQNYLSLSFFNALFQARTSQGAVVAPNSGDTTTIDNIKAMFGFWTDQYISALGQGADGGAITSLAALTDVSLSLPLADGEVLTYSTTLGKWTNGAGVSTAWANITGKPTTIAGYGITDAHITNGVITLGSNSITPITSLTGYATESWVNTQLGSYVTTTALGTTLADYVTTTALATALADYVTTSALATALADYVTTTALATTLADYATKTYVDQNYLSLSFFNALFQARTSQGAVVAPNSGDTTTIDNIKAMFGFWTDQYISALGQGADGGAVTSLAALTDVELSTPINDGEVLTYSTTLGKWTNGAGVSTSWANITGKPTTIAGYGITDAYISNGTITLGSNSITPVTSLSGYATQSWVQQQGYITGITSSMVISALGYTPANSTALSNYLPLSGGTMASGSYIRFTDGTYEIRVDSINNRLSVGSYSQSTAKGLNVGNLLVSSAWADYDKVPTNGIYSKGVIRSGVNSGTAPFIIDSTSVVSNLNADFLDGQHGSYYAPVSALSNYLPLSGGNLSGTISFPFTSYAIYWGNNSQFRLGSNGDTDFFITGEDGSTADFKLYTARVQRLFVSGTNGNVGVGLQNPSQKLHVNGNVASEGFIKSNSSDSYVLTGGGSHALISGLSVGSADKWTTSRNLFGVSVDGSSDTGLGTIISCRYLLFRNSTDDGNIGYIGRGANDNTYYISTYANIPLQFYVNNSFALAISTSRYVGIGTSNPSYRLHVDGDIYATGGVTALSDIRHKTIVEDTRLQVSDIARMRAVRYLWNDGRKDNGMHVGSIAQDWQQILPEVVLRANDDEGTLSLQYGVAALISSITIARKVVNHEQRITELEKECERLRFENEQLRLKIA